MRNVVQNPDELPARASLPPLSNEQVRAGARTGETWSAARLRLTKQRDRLASWPRDVYPCGCADQDYGFLGRGWIVESDSAIPACWCEVCEGDFTAPDDVETDTCTDHE